MRESSKCIEAVELLELICDLYTQYSRLVFADYGLCSISTDIHHAGGSPCVWGSPMGQQTIVKFIGIQRPSADGRYPCLLLSSLPQNSSGRFVSAAGVVLELSISSVSASLLWAIISCATRISFAEQFISGTAIRLEIRAACLLVAI